MTTPSGTISASDIITEFGNSNSNGGMSLGAYRQHKLANGNLSNYPQTVNGISFSALDTNVPVGGQIKYSDLRNKKLNFVVDYQSFSQDRQNSTSHIDMQVRWQQGNSATVGNFKDAPTDSGSWNGGKKVFIHVNQTFGSITDNNRNVVALRTGSQWPNNTEMEIQVGSNGRIFGAGGRGGHGSNGSGNGGAAENGNSALGIQIAGASAGTGNTCTVRVKSGGIIQCGFEGGGGGGGFYDDPNKSSQDPVISGGGGGGGAGRPIGVGGNAGTGSQHGPNGDAGTNATNTVRGLGGSGKNGSQGSSRSGDGGNGADKDNNSENGDNATQGGGSANPKVFGSGGNKGLRGAAIRRTNATCGYALIIEGSGRVTGDGNPPTSAPTGID